MTDRPAFLYITEDGPVMRVWANGIVSGFPPGAIVNNIGALIDAAYAQGFADGRAAPAFSLRGLWARVRGR